MTTVASSSSAIRSRSSARSFVPGPLGAILCIGAFVLLVLYPLMFLGRALYWGDLLLYFYPLDHAISQALRAGRLPLWNPYVNCGQPLLGNPQASVFYPTTALLRWLPAWQQYSIVVALHLFGAGLGVYLYVQRITSDRLSAILGAVTFAGGGFAAARLQFPTMVQSLAYLPWLLLLVELIVEDPSLLRGALLALAVGLLVLAGHAQIAYMSMAASAVYALVRLWPARGNRRDARRAFFVLAAAAAVGILLASVQVLPTLQIFSESTRERLTWRQSNRFVLLPEQFLGLIFPRFFGTPSKGDYWGSGNAWEPCAYVGVIPLFLAGAALAWAGSRRSVRFYVLLTFTSLWLALGKYGGLFWIAFYVVPGIASFHDPARFTFLAAFALAILGALGLRALRDRGVCDRTRLMLVVLSAVNLVWFSSGYNPTVRPAALDARADALGTIRSGSPARVYSALHDEVWKRFLNYADYQRDDPHYVGALTDTLEPNIGMRFGVEEASGYEPVPLRAVTEVDGLIREAIERQAPNLPGLLGLFNVRWLLLPEAMPYPHPAVERVPARGVAVYELRETLPRAWLVRRTVRVDGAQRALAAISEPEFDPLSLAVVSDAPGLGEERSYLGEPVAPANPVNVTYASASRFAATATAGSEPAFLVRSCAYYPGWCATVDGRPASVERTDRAIQGVRLSPGRHVVRFAFEPSAVRAGIYLSLLAAAMITCALVYGAARGLQLPVHSQR